MTMNTRTRLDDVRVFIATPAYGGLVTTDYLHSLMATRARLASLGAVVAVYTIASESLITRARNACVARFMAASVAGQPFTHLAFIDADVSFPAFALERLVRSGLPLCAAAYPLKQLGAGYPIEVEVPTETQDDFISALSVGTGFLCLTRAALEQLLAAHADTRYDNDVPGYALPAADHELGPLSFHELFTTRVDPDTRRYLSEDYALCKRWRALGGKVWVDLRAQLCHVGSHRYQGDVATWLESIGAITRVRPPG